MYFQRYNLNLTTNLSRSKSELKLCCICLDKSKKYKKCSKCVDGIICYNCLNKLMNKHIMTCPICRYESDIFDLQSKFKIPYQKIGNLVILYTLIFFFDNFIPSG